MRSVKPPPPPPSTLGPPMLYICGLRTASRANASGWALVYARIIRFLTGTGRIRPAARTKGLRFKRRLPAGSCQALARALSRRLGPNWRVPVAAKLVFAARLFQGLIRASRMSAKAAARPDGRGNPATLGRGRRGKIGSIRSAWPPRPPEARLSPRHESARQLTRQGADRQDHRPRRSGRHAVLTGHTASLGRRFRR